MKEFQNSQKQFLREPLNDFWTFLKFLSKASRERLAGTFFFKKVARLAGYLMPANVLRRFVEAPIFLEDLWKF